MTVREFSKERIWIKDSDPSSQVIAAFPQNEDDMTALVMPDRRSKTTFWPDIVIMQSADATNTLLRELLRRGTSANADQQAFVRCQLRSLLLFVQLLLSHPSTKDDPERQRTILGSLGARDPQQPTRSLCATLLELARNPVTARAISPEFVRALRMITPVIEHGFLAATDDMTRSVFSDRFDLLTETLRELETSCLGVTVE